MTYNLSVKQLKRRKGPASERVTAAAAVEEAEGDQGRERGLHFLLGKPLHPPAPLREAVAAPAPLSVKRRPGTGPALPPRDTKSGTTTLILYGSTFPGSRRKGGGA